eukprot:12384449-Ditylum_brightwellii.AAC.1
MFNSMEMKYNHILDVSEQTVHTKKQFTIQVFRDLLTTTNQDFHCYMKGKKDLFNEGHKVNIFEIIYFVRTHYINNKSDFDKLDPKDAAIIGLTSKLSTLETKFKSKSNPQGGSGGKGGNGKGNDKNDKSGKSNKYKKNRGLLEW